MRQKFDNEVTALAKIQHPGVVAVTDSGETDSGHPFFVMEFVDGQPLVNLLNPQGVQLRDGAEILKQLGSALSAAHALNICHRDLKPENILLQDTGAGRHVKIIDFGIASLFDVSVVRETKIVGSLPYMAPEQLEGRVNAFSDIYALGVIAYELLTGKIPFDVTAPVELHARQQRGEFKRPADLRPELPPEASDLICQALAFQPESRFSSAREFACSLYDALTGAPVSRKFNASPRSVVNAGRIVAKMCDRRAQEDDFKAFFLKNSTERPGQAQCVVVHGEEGACHESLVERFAYAVERISGNSHGQERPTLKLKKVPWQYEGSAAVRQKRLLMWLVEQLCPQSPHSIAEITPQEFAVGIGQSQAEYLVLEHDIRVSRWDSVGADLIGRYLEFLGSVPATNDAPTILTFFNFIYPARPETSSTFTWFTDWPQRRLKGRVQTDVRQAVARGAKCPTLLLSELKAITKDDVMEWFTLQNIYDSEEKRLRASEWVFAAPDGKALAARSMAEIESKLQDVHRNHLAERGMI